MVDMEEPENEKKKKGVDDVVLNMDEENTPAALATVLTALSPRISREY